MNVEVLNIGDFRIRADSHNFILEEAKLRQKQDKSTEIYWNTVGYFGLLENAARKIHKLLMLKEFEDPKILNPETVEELGNLSKQHKDRIVKEFSFHVSEFKKVLEKQNEND